MIQPAIKAINQATYNLISKLFALCVFCTITISCSLRLKERMHVASIEHVSIIVLPATINLYYNFYLFFFPPDFFFDRILAAEAVARAAKDATAAAPKLKI